MHASLGTWDDERLREARETVMSMSEERHPPSYREVCETLAKQQHTPLYAEHHTAHFADHSSARQAVKKDEKGGSEATPKTRSCCDVLLSFLIKSQP